jgi:hypothetical protein
MEFYGNDREGNWETKNGGKGNEKVLEILDEQIFYKQGCFEKGRRWIMKKAEDGLEDATQNWAYSYTAGRVGKPSKILTESDLCILSGLVPRKMICNSTTPLHKFLNRIIPFHYVQILVNPLDIAFDIAFFGINAIQRSGRGFIPRTGISAAKNYVFAGQGTLTLLLFV